MEGANLYDVFQKISKGEYEGLPAEQFSSTLRQLITRMLQVGRHVGQHSDDYCWATRH